MSATTSFFEATVRPRLERSDDRLEWLAAARRVALHLGRGGRLVTIKQVRDSKDCPPLPAHIDSRICGAVFNRADWVLVDRVNSSSMASHGRPIGRFVRVEYA